MADLEKPKTKTDDLADRVIKSVAEDGNVSSFQNEINGLSQSEQLQFVKDLRSNALDQNVKGNDQFLYVDAHTDDKTGDLVDLDLVKVDHGEGGEPKRDRTDLLTPEEGGKAFDKRQEIDEQLKPYVNLLGLMNTHDSLSRQQYSFGDRLGGDGRSYPDRNKDVVKGLLEENLKDNPDREAILKAFETPWDRTQDKGYTAVDSIDTVMAGIMDMSKLPENIRGRFEYLRQAVQELRKSDPYQNYPRERH
ncbi:MAG TPA: hypothetical protein PKD05_24200 [Candidatus Melainabacteria bacterium]|nr:hypothetical protein [Candidatus Melainabacteria bacterium]HMP54673.1 hypothetical protein [Candidatus Melainabacteria bacterium]